MAHPIGSIYSSTASTSPADLFGGTWERIKGRFIWGIDDSENAGDTGGEATHKLTVDEMPSHNHTITFLNGGDGGIATDGLTVQRGYYGNGDNLAKIPQNFEISNNGGNMPHNNMPPYYGAYVWRRTA